MNKIKIVGFLIIVFNLQVLFLYGQNKPDTINTESAIQDFHYFVELLEKTHVDPYSSVGGILNFKIRVAQFEDKIRESLKVTDLATILSEFLSYLNDNHTYIRTDNIDWTTNKQLPFFCDVASDCIYIKAIKEEYANLYGAKIISINNMNLDTLLIISANLQSSENISNLKANLCWQIVNKQLAENLFKTSKDTVFFKLLTLNQDTIQQNFYYQSQQELNRHEWYKKPINIDIDNSGIFSFQFVDDNKQIMYYRLDEMFAQEVVEMIEANNANHGNWISSILNRYYPDLNNIENGVNSIPYFTNSFKEMLNKMRNNHSKYLILDLSKNGGGYSALAIPALYMMFGDSCFSTSNERKYVTRISQLYLDKYKMTIDDYNSQQKSNYKIGDYNLGDLLTPDQQVESNQNNRLKYFEYLEQNNFGWAKFIKDFGGTPIYKPQIIVLISAQTNSAAYHFLYDLYKLGNITTIGIAAKQAGNTFMEATPFVLPNTRIVGSISNSYQVMFPHNDNKSKLFEPDFPINWIDFQKKGMSVTSNLEIAIDLIKQGLIK